METKNIKCKLILIRAVSSKTLLTNQIKMQIEKIKRIVEDIKSDREWVCDSHTHAEYVGVKSGLDMLVRHLEETTDEQDLKEVSTQDLRNELELRGYQTDNLWHIEDVVQTYDVESEDAMEILKEAMNNEYLVETTFTIIDEVFNNKLKNDE